MNTTIEKPYVVGIDIGGTNTVFGIVDARGTIIACAKALTAAGTTAIDVVVTHALFPRTVYDEMISSGIRSVRSTHSVPHITNAIALDHLLAASLRSEMAEASQ